MYPLSVVGTQNDFNLCAIIQFSPNIALISGILIMLTYILFKELQLLGVLRLVFDTEQMNCMPCWGRDTGPKSRI